jgi:hypothetical protein
MLEAKIEALTAAIEALTEVVIDALSAQAAQAPLETKPLEIAPIKVAKPKAAKLAPVEPVLDTPMSIEDLTRAALFLSREGKGDAVRAMLAALGVTRISLLAGDQVAAFEAFIKGDVT